MASRLDRDLSALEDMDLASLSARWRDLHDSAPPRLPADLLRLGIAWALQERRHGGVPAMLLRRLRQRGDGGQLAAIAPKLKPGTRLVRTWRGRTIAVSVEADGFYLDGRRYTSLTQIARDVTGAAWSGPRFFGLVDRRAR